MEQLLASMNAVIPSASTEEVRAKVELARRAQAEWGKLSVKTRVSFLKRFGEILAARQDEFSKLITQETGKPPVDALSGEILSSLLWIDYVCRYAPKLLRPRKISTGWIFTHQSTVTFDPLGVVGIITPWNYPVYITLSSAAAALAAGNAVITKPSRLTPLCVLKLEEMLKEAGLPAGVFQVIPGDEKTGLGFIQAGVDKMVFTGSVETGRKISVACAEKFIPCTLELGGKDPMIVLDDAPMPRAVHGALYGGLCHAGQMCMSIERVYVTEKAAPEFLKSLVLEAKKLALGTDVGPLQSEEQLRKVEAQVEEALSQGASVLVGAQRGLQGGNFYLPTILYDVPEDSRMAREESFGPVFWVKVVQDEEEAVLLANESLYGLAASIWTKNIPRAREMAAQLHTASVFINDHITPATNPHAPWGGMKESGLGTQRGEWGVYSMTQVRHIGRSRLLLSKDAFWFPRTAKQEEIARGLIRGLFAGKWAQRVSGLWKIVRAYLR